MHFSYFSRRCFISIASLVLVGCVYDDQTSIKPEHQLYANPPPISEDGRPERFRENNDRHKILVGIFDTGIDYNHPYLRNHVHFDLDAQGVPQGAGLDFLSNGDAWASHRLIQTGIYEYEFLSERQRKQAILSKKAPEEWDKHIRRSEMGKICAANYLLKIDQRLEQYIQPYRALSDERDNTQHGSHVAGLASYDNEAIGIVPYRLIPYYETEQEEADAARGKTDKFVSNFAKALEHARRVGIKIVNLSLGGSFKKPTDTNDSSYEANLEKFENYQRLLQEGLNALVASYPEILFVAAAGNDSGWSDNESRLQYPCGLEAPNILCVGALNKDGTLAQFTNLPVNQVDLVMASGVKVISTIPADNCQYLSRQLSDFLTDGSNYTGLCSYDIKDKTWKESPVFAERFSALIGTFYDQCSRKKELFKEMSGTSMATPIVTRLAAQVWLAQPELDPKGVIAALKATATADSKRKLVAYKLKAAMPSWYSLFYDKASSEGNLPVVDENLNFPANWLPSLGDNRKASARSVSKSLQSWFEFLVPRKR